MRRPARRAGCAGEDHAQDVAVPVLGDQVAEGEAAPPPPAARTSPAPSRSDACGGRRATRDASRPSRSSSPSAREVVLRRLDAHEETVERGDVDAGRVVTRLERLHERRARAAERVEHVPAALDVAVEQHLDELRDELAVVRVKAVDVLRPLALGQRRLRPREVEVQRRVELVLRDGHGPNFDMSL